MKKIIHRLRFNKWASKYDNCILQSIVFHKTHDIIIEKILDNLWWGDTILDVACGTGKLLLKLQKRVGFNVKLYGIDISEGMINQASPKSSKIQWRIEDVENLQCKDNVFNIITCAHAFHHFQHQIIAMKEMHRVLKPGGILIVADGNPQGLWGKIVFGIVKLHERNVHHASDKETREMFLKVGFENIIQSRYNILTPTLITMGKKRT